MKKLECESQQIQDHLGDDREEFLRRILSGEHCSDLNQSLSLPLLMEEQSNRMGTNLWSVNGRVLVTSRKDH